MSPNTISFVRLDYDSPAGNIAGCVGIGVGGEPTRHARELVARRAVLFADTAAAILFTPILPTSMSAYPMAIRASNDALGRFYESRFDAPARGYTFELLTCNMVKIKCNGIFAISAIGTPFLNLKSINRSAKSSPIFSLCKFNLLPVFRSVSPTCFKGIFWMKQCFLPSTSEFFCAIRSITESRFKPGLLWVLRSPFSRISKLFCFYMRQLAILFSRHIANIPDAESLSSQQLYLHHQFHKPAILIILRLSNKKGGRRFLSGSSLSFHAVIR
jgi:hypothetical protein